MPYKNKEDKIANGIAYRQANREKINQRMREYNEENKEQSRDYYQANREHIIQYHKEYNQTETGVKRRMMSHWKASGVKNVNDEMYDYYMNCNKCEVCKNEFKSSLDKCLDHDHDTGLFRFVLCRSCNVNDNWKKKIIQ